jgi:hypothetical protein
MVPNSVMQGGHNILKAGMHLMLQAKAIVYSYSHTSVTLLLVHTFSA